MAGESVRQSGIIFSQALRRSYAHLGLVMAISVVWFTLAGIPAAFMLNFCRLVPNLISFLITGVVFTFLSGPVTVAVYSVANALVHDEPVNFSSLWYRFRSHYKQAAQVTAVMFGIILILLVDIIVFLQSKIRFVQWLSVFWLYFIFFWFMLTNYVYALVVNQQVSWVKVLQRAVLLALDNIVVTVLLLVEIAVIAAFCFFSILPVPLYLGGAIALLHVTAFNTILQKYNDNTVPETAE